MKLVAPANISHFEMDNVVYERDEHGHFHIDNADHAKKARILGAVDHVPGVDPFAVKDTEDLLAEKDARIAELEAAGGAPADNSGELDELRAKLAEAEEARAAAEERARAAEAALVPAEDANASGDTSEGAGGASDDAGEPTVADKVGAYLNDHPDFTGEDLDRDGKVEWLKSVGVVISVSSSKVAAQTAIEETIADYRASQKGE